MFKMGGSDLSGAGVYEGWSIEKKKIVSGGITRFPNNTVGYFNIFVQLMKSSQFTRRSDLVVAREFFEKLGIDY
jgi:hypothetical protein